MTARAPGVEPALLEGGRLAALAARLRAVLDLSRADLAALLGLGARALAAPEPGGPAAAALTLLAEVPRARVGPALAALARARGEDADAAAELARHAARAVEELGGAAARLGELCEGPVEWAWWAPSPDPRLRALADRLGLLPRALLRDGPQGAALDLDLFAPRAGDPVLLCLGGEPAAWYRVAEGDAWPGALRSPHAERLRLGPALPPVLRFVPAEGAEGAALAAAGCRLADGRAPVGGPDEWFAGLAVRPLDAAVPARGRLAAPARPRAFAFARLREAGGTPG